MHVVSSAFASWSQSSVNQKSRDGWNPYLWYHVKMKKLGSTSGRKRIGTVGVTVGRERFAKISSVEGIVLTDAAKKRAKEFDRSGLSPEERVRRIIAIHRKG
jgi:hypothetical protein